MFGHLGLLVCITGLVPRPYGLHVFFPKYEELPQDVSQAKAQNYSLELGCSTETKIGDVYIHADQGWTLAPFYAKNGQLAGVIFAVEGSALQSPDEAFSPWSFENHVGHVYWTLDPNTICTSDEPAAGLWTALPDGIGGITQLPQTPAGLDSLGGVDNGISGKWTEHLCLTGMGTHYLYEECGSNYVFGIMYDASLNLVGVVHSINLKEAMDTQVLETVPVHNLKGLVFNETRMLPCDTDQATPRVLLHAYVKKPEVEYQSCAADMEFTALGEAKRGKRCELCGVATNNLASGAALASQLFDNPGSCAALGCAPASATTPVSSTVAGTTIPRQAAATTLFIALLRAI